MRSIRPPPTGRSFSPSLTAERVGYIIRAVGEGYHQRLFVLFWRGAVNVKTTLTDPYFAVLGRIW